MNRAYALLPVLSLALAMPAEAAAPAGFRDIQFSVPVQLTNYAATRANVWCDLRNAAGQPVMSGARGAPPMNVGAGLAVFGVQNGAYNGSVSVVVLIPDTLAPLVRTWRCVLSVNNNEDGRGTAESSIPAYVVPLTEVSGRF